MSPRNRKADYLLALGGIVVAVPELLNRHVSFGDSSEGMIRGFGLGLMLLALIILAKQRRLARNSGQ